MNQDIEKVDFSVALPQLIAGGKIARASWEKGMNLELLDGVIEKVEPNGNERVSFQFEHHDILADDWMITEEA